MTCAGVEVIRTKLIGLARSTLPYDNSFVQYCLVFHSVGQARETDYHRKSDSVVLMLLYDNEESSL